jgi:hypothetical protein
VITLTCAPLSGMKDLAVRVEVMRISTGPRAGRIVVSAKGNTSGTTPRPEPTQRSMASVLKWRAGNSTMFFGFDRLDLDCQLGETRYVITGLVNGMLLTVVHRARGPHSDHLRPKGNDA